MKRQDWVWVFTKVFGIYFLVVGFLYFPAIVQHKMVVLEQSPLFDATFVFYLLTLVLTFAAGFILLLCTNWMLWLVGIQPEKDKEAEAPEQKVEKTASSSPDGRKNILWILIKALGVYFAFVAIIRIPMSIYQLATTLSSDGERYSLVEDRILSQAVTEYIQLGIGACLIIFTGFFVRLVTRYGLLSNVKDKLKYAGE